MDDVKGTVLPEILLGAGARGHADAPHHAFAAALSMAATADAAVTLSTAPAGTAAGPALPTANTGAVAPAEHDGGPPLVGPAAPAVDPPAGAAVPPNGEPPLHRVGVDHVAPPRTADPARPERRGAAADAGAHRDAAARGDARPDARVAVGRDGGPGGVDGAASELLRPHGAAARADGAAAPDAHAGMPEGGVAADVADGERHDGDGDLGVGSRPAPARPVGSADRHASTGGPGVPARDAGRSADGRAVADDATLRDASGSRRPDGRRRGAAIAAVQRLDAAGSAARAGGVGAAAASDVHQTADDGAAPAAAASTDDGGAAAADRVAHPVPTAPRAADDVAPAAPPARHVAGDRPHGGSVAERPAAATHHDRSLERPAPTDPDPRVDGGARRPAAQPPPIPDPVAPPRSAPAAHQSGTVDAAHQSGSADVAAATRHVDAVDGGPAWRTAPQADVPAGEARAQAPGGAMAARIAEIAVRLRALPPPQRMEIDLEQHGGGRLIVSLDADVVHIDGVDRAEQRDAAWWREVDDALRQRGLSLGSASGRGGRDGRERRRPLRQDAWPPPAAPARTARHEPDGALRL